MFAQFMQSPLVKHILRFAKVGLCFGLVCGISITILAEPARKLSIKQLSDTERKFQAHLYVDSMVYYTEAKQFARAEIAFETANELLINLPITNEYLKLHYIHSELLRSLYRLKEAEQSLIPVLAADLSPLWRARILLRMAGIRFELSKHDKALAHCKQIDDILLVLESNLGKNRNTPQTNSNNSTYTTELDQELITLNTLREIRFTNTWLRGSIYASTKNPLARTVILNAIELATPADSANLAMLYTHLSRALENEGNVVGAKAALKQATWMAKHNKVLAQQEFIASEMLLLMIKHEGKEGLLEQIEIWTRLRDSLKNSNRAENYGLAAARHEVEHARADAKRLALVSDIQKQRIILLGVGGGICLALAMLLAYVAYIARQNAFVLSKQTQLVEKQHAELTAQKQLLETQKQLLEGSKTGLEQLNATKDVLLSVVSHDVRAPLQSLRSSLDLLTRGHFTPQEFLELTKPLIQRVADTESLLNDVLIWVKSQMTGLIPDSNPVLLSDVIRQVVAQSSPLLETYFTKLEIATETPTTVLADEGMLKVVIRNLLSNSIRYGPKKGTIRIQHILKGNKVCISISDQGPGIPQALIARILNQQPEILGRQELSAGGLGLVLVRDLMMLQKGQVEIDVKPNGTTVHLWLPTPVVVPSIMAYSDIT
jgi:signal transduction histidine kinase